MKESCATLNKGCSAGVRDNSRCGLASFENICSDDYAGKAGWNFGTFEKDQLIKNEADCRTLKKVLKYGCSTFPETSISALNTFDAKITDTTDSFAFCS